MNQPRLRRLLDRLLGNDNWPYWWTPQGTLGARLPNIPTISDADLDLAEAALTRPDCLLWEDAQPRALTILLGRGLVGDLAGPIQSVRAALQQELGFSMPEVRLNSNFLRLKWVPDNVFAIEIHDTEVCRRLLRPDRLLVQDPFDLLPGDFDPVGGKWIAPKLRPHAQLLGITPLDCHEIIAHELHSNVRAHAAELFSLPQLEQMLAALDPPSHRPLGQLHAILCARLRQGLSIAPLEHLL